jgi:two-component system chemotaxis response regulator CheB
MPGHDIIVIGASSGGIEALTEVAARLPEDIPAALFVVVHVAPRSVSVLPEILNRAGPLTAAHARDNEKIKSGREERAQSAAEQAETIKKLLLSGKLSEPVDKIEERG